MPLPKRSDIKLHLISLLKEQGPLRTTAVYKALAQQWQLSEAEKAVTRSGGLLYENEIRWARQELALSGVLERPYESGRAIWKLRDTEFVAPEEYDGEPDCYLEGSTKRISVNAYERNRKARIKCLEARGYSCIVCGFNFEETFGEIGKNCIHVHHIVELSTIQEEYKVNPSKDLVPVCPNCHYLIHRRRPAFTIEEARAMLRSNNSCKLISVRSMT